MSGTFWKPDSDVGQEWSEIIRPESSSWSFGIGVPESTYRHQPIGTERPSNLDLERMVTLSRFRTWQQQLELRVKRKDVCVCGLGNQTEKCFAAPRIHGYVWMSTTESWLYPRCRWIPKYVEQNGKRFESSETLSKLNLSTSKVIWTTHSKTTLGTSWRKISTASNAGRHGNSHRPMERYGQKILKWIRHIFHIWPASHSKKPWTLITYDRRDNVLSTTTTWIIGNPLWKVATSWRDTRFWCSLDSPQPECHRIPGMFIAWWPSVRCFWCVHWNTETGNRLPSFSLSSVLSQQ